mgnify:CR=1 FL=1
MNIRICPNCNSPNTEVKQSLLWIGDRIYHCKRCHFESTLFPEIMVKNLNELRKLKLRPLKKTKAEKKTSKGKGKARNKISKGKKKRSSHGH